MTLCYTDVRVTSVQKWAREGFGDKVSGDVARAPELLSKCKGRAGAP